MAKSQELIDALNAALADEYAQHIEMATQAAVTRGPDARTLKPFLEEQATSALAHAALLRERVFNLGGTPTTAVGKIHVHGTAAEALAVGA
jgi:bacterioferritin (cytochrome b1)